MWLRINAWNVYEMENPNWDQCLLLASEVHSENKISSQFLREPFSSFHRALQYIFVPLFLLATETRK